METRIFGKTMELAKSLKPISQVTFTANVDGFVVLKAHNPNFEPNLGTDLSKICVNYAGVYLHEVNEYFCITGGLVNGHINPNSLSIPVSKGQKFSIHSQSGPLNNMDAEVAFYFSPVGLYSTNDYKEIVEKVKAEKELA